MSSRRLTQQQLEALVRYQDEVDVELGIARAFSLGYRTGLERAAEVCDTRADALDKRKCHDDAAEAAMCAEKIRKEISDE
jgi:hypothetical protein